MIGDWSEQQLESFVRARLNLPPNLAQKIATPTKLAPVMENGWANYNDSVFYWQDGLSYGHIAGEVQDPGGATVAAGTVLFTLPFAPVYRGYFAVVDSGVFRDVLVTTVGDVQIGDSGFAVGSTQNLGHVSFPLF